MNQEQIAEKLKAVSQDKVYKGGLSAYAVQSIKSGRSNYPVSNLIAYCQDLGLKFVMTDLATEDCFCPMSVFDVHKVLDLLMNRYEVDNKLIYRKTAVHYTAPKSLVEEELEKSSPHLELTNMWLHFLSRPFLPFAKLSIAICLLLIDESSVIITIHYGNKKELLENPKKQLVIISAFPNTYLEIMHLSMSTKFPKKVHFMKRPVHYQMRWDLIGIRCLMRIATA